MAAVLEVVDILLDWNPGHLQNEMEYRRNCLEYLDHHIQKGSFTTLVDSNYKNGDPIDVSPRSSGGPSLQTKVLLSYNHVCYADILLGDQPIELKHGPRTSGELQRLLGQILQYRMSGRNDYLVLLCECDAVARNTNASYATISSQEDLLRRQSAYINTIIHAVSCIVCDAGFNGEQIQVDPMVAGDIGTVLLRRGNEWQRLT